MGKKMLMFYVQRINAIETVTPDWFYSRSPQLPPCPLKVDIPFAKGRLVSAPFATTCAQPCSVSFSVLVCNSGAKHQGSLEDDHSEVE